MRRRRRDNKTLGKTMLIAVGIVLLMLPILGYLGAFKAVKQQYMEVTMVKLPPPPPIEKQAQAKKAHPKTQTRRGGQTHVAGSSKPISVHVAAAAGSPNSSGDANSIVNSNNTNIGAAPAAAGTGTGSAGPATPPPAPPPPVVTPPPPVQPAPPAAPSDQSAEVIADSQVKPTIPDELRDSDLDTQFRGLFTVHADGTAQVKMLSSTGNNELDQLALEAARQWRFRPAVHDGKAVDSFLRLVVEFQVS